MTDSQLEGWLEIGRIVAPQGLQGEMRVYPDSDFPERFLEPGDRWLQKPGQTQPEKVHLVSGRYLAGKGLYIIRLKGVTNREQAEALRESSLMISKSDRLPLESDEFHVSDLVGLVVRLKPTGEEIGTVVDVYAAGNDLLAIELFQNARETVQTQPSDNTAQKSKLPPTPILIPFVYEIVPTVNLAEGFVEIDPPRGLLPDQ